MSDVDPAQRREKITTQVAALLAKAESSTFGPERDAFIAKADDLMAKYSIEMFELDFAQDKTKRRKPELRTIEYGRTGSEEADNELVQVFYSLAQMVGVQMGQWGWRHSKVVGYAEDLDYLQMLFLNIRLHMALQLEPKPDQNMSMEDNLVMLKEAGMKWERIYSLLHAAGQLDVPWERKVGVRFTGIYTKYCKENDCPRMYTNPDVWRRNFIAGYSSEIRRRISEMTTARKEAARGHELVLVSMKEDLLEALYEFFPENRPHPPSCDCDLCHRCSNIKCQRPNCKLARQPVKYSRGPRTVREMKYDSSAQQAGRGAARTADLGSARGAPSSEKQGDQLNEREEICCCVQHAGANVCPQCPVHERTLNLKPKEKS